MSDHACSNCARLQQENLELKQRIRRLKGAIKRQKRQLDYVRLYVGKVMNDAGRVFSQHQARAVWAFWKGKSEVATRVWDLIKFDWVQTILDIIQENL